MPIEEVMDGERRDPLHEGGPTSSIWTTVNAAEALPGVCTPLGWTWAFEGIEWAGRGAFADIGAIPKHEVRIVTELDDRLIAVFCGRCACNVNFLRRIGDAMPGSSGDAVEEKLLGKASEGVPSRKNYKRYPIVAVKLPISTWRAFRRLKALDTEVDRWWRRAVAPGGTCTAAEARALIEEARRYQGATMRAHGVVTMVGIGCFEQLQKLCQRAHKPGLELLLVRGGYDVCEAKMIDDFLDVTHRGASLEVFLADHGFHGPNEGELSSRSWREDPGPLEALAQAYRKLNGAERMREDAGRRQAETELLCALSPARRIAARLLLRLARAFVPVRECGRSTFLKTDDVARAMARHLGQHLSSAGVLRDPEDVFYLTMDELLAALPAELDAAIAFRKKRRETYLQHDLPDRSEGQPQPIAIAPADDMTEHGQLAGLGVSAGVVEGRALVVTDVADPGDILRGDILVCHTTDPSWASLFFLVAGCVIDIGGPMSHGAIVARELGLPCVINTRIGTRRLRTGDYLRLDGTSGTIEILKRAVDEGTAISAPSA